jgi:transcriptional regulator with XRE-family HTH domain
MITLTTQWSVQRERAGRKRLSKPRVANAETGDQVPRISRLMALAIKFQAMLRDGIVRDQSELARLARVTQPRMTQILNLNFLAPDIQEAILFLKGDTAVSEKSLRPVTVETSWDVQLRNWKRCCGT